MCITRTRPSTGPRGPWVTYKKARQPINVWNIMTLATDLSRLADGTVPPESFEANCERALRVLLEYQRRLDESDVDESEGDT